MKFRKTSRTPFLQNTSSGCFCQKRLQHKCSPVKFAKFLRTPVFTEHLRWLLLNGHFSLVRCVITRISMTFCWFLACVKDIFDSRILFPRTSCWNTALSFWFWCHSIRPFKSMLLLTNHNYTEHIHVQWNFSKNKKNSCIN